MKKYIGARLLLRDPVRLGLDGRIIQPGDVCELIPEREAIERADFEPVYETETRKEKKESFGGDE